MQLSQESYRIRWLVLVTAWAVTAYALFSQASSVRQYFDVVGQLGTRGSTTVSTPLNQMYPAFAADAQTWVRHALSLLEGHDLRLRYTTIDNAPVGREVHWNSAWAWAIAGAGWVYHLFTGLPLANSVERATVWLNPSAFFVLIAVLSAWVTRRAGLIAGIVVVAAMVGNDRIYEGFFPYYVDHHGLLTVAVFGTMLGAILMGGGWWQQPGAESPILPISPKQARTAARFSAICGACGLWVSAASVIPGIALVGIAGMLTILVQGPTAQRKGARFDPDTWRTWGRVGAIASLIFYLLEYFPNHLSLRLEANHPFHALAWMGAGELIAQFGSWWLASPESRRIEWRALIWPIVAVSLAPLTMIIGGPKVFSILDPFMSRLHSDYIQEFLPIWRTIQNFDAKLAFQVLVVDSAPLIAGIATLTYLARNSPIVLWFSTLAALLFSILAWWQSRWLLNASGIQICVALVVLTCWARAWVPWSRWVLALAVVGALYAPTIVMRHINTARDVKSKFVSQRDAHNALARDIAAKIRATQPTGDIVLLTSPNASTGVGYYGRFKTLGTLYWENAEGLKAAASIFAARSEQEAATLLRAHRVTHIAIVSEENFIQQYVQLLNPNATVEQLRKCFGVRLYFDKFVPQWLETIPYKVPDDLAQLKVSVMLFKVNFKQSLAEAIYNVALNQIEQGAVTEAERTLEILLQQLPQAYQPWLRKGELLIARRDWSAAAENLLKGISLAPPAERTVLFTNYAKPFYDARQYELAIRIYRAALANQQTADASCYLAWILATVPNDTLRSAKEALSLAEQAVKTDPTSPAYLNTLAAALAENGRLPEAVAAGERALANSQLRRDPINVQQIFANRLETLRSGKALRIEP